MENKRNKIKIEINENRDFKGVWIPKKIWVNEELIWTEKILLVEINSLDNNDGCYAGNEHFSKFLGISKDRVSKLISSLKSKGYIYTRMIYKDGTKEVDKRIINVERSKFNETNEDRNIDGLKNIEGVVSNNDTPIVSNNEDINTLIPINTINNKDIKDIVPAKADTIPYETIVEHLNLKTGKNFKHQTPATRKLIKARWNEGNELDEFKKVIDTMVHNWKDDLKMKGYLQPSTLFSTKFENYLNQEKKQTFTNQQQNKAWEDDIYGNSTNSYDYGYNQQQLSKPNEQNRQQIILQQP